MLTPMQLASPNFPASEASEAWFSAKLLSLMQSSVLPDIFMSSLDSAHCEPGTHSARDSAQQGPQPAVELPDRLGWPLCVREMLRAL